MIRETEPQVFKARLNETMKRLKDRCPEAKVNIEGDTLDALISYVEDVAIEELTPAEAGIKFICEDCPMFYPETKRDGSPDLRSKWGDCIYAEMHRTSKQSSACDLLYGMIKNGDIRLTLSEPCEETKER